MNMVGMDCAFHLIKTHEYVEGEREKEDVIIYQNSRIWFGEYVEEGEREREVG